MPAPADEDDRRPLGRDGTPPAAARRAGVRARWRAHLSSRRKHYAIVGLVALDVLVLLADILITLVTCELGRPDAGWVATVREVGRIAGLVFSALFLAELAASVWAFGLGWVPSLLLVVAPPFVPVPLPACSGTNAATAGTSARGFTASTPSSS